MTATRQLARGTILAADGQLACRLCGQQTPREGKPATVRAVDYHPLGHVRDTHPVEVGLCEDCRTLTVQGDRLAADYRLPYAQAVGVAVAALLARQPLPDTDVATVARHVGSIGYAACWESSLTVDMMDAAARKPWAHAKDQRKLAVRAFADLAAERVAALGDDRLVGPPVVQPNRSTAAVDDGCLHCGVWAVSASAGWVHRRGGTVAASGHLWQQATVAASALGVKGGGLVAGHLCPDCATVRGSRGVGGQATLEATYAKHAGVSYDPSRDKITGVRAWGGLVVNARRRQRDVPEANTHSWEHVCHG